MQNKNSTKNSSNNIGPSSVSSIASPISAPIDALKTSMQAKSAHKQAPVVAALDIGSSKVAVVIATVSESNQLEVVGVGTAPNAGIKQGIVVNIEATAESIRKAREEAELMSGYRIADVFVSVSGSHIKSFDSKGMVAIKNREVTQSDVDRVIEAAKAIAVPNDRHVLHVIPREFKVDGQDGILDPIGMSGVRLEASVHIVTASATAVANNLKCIEKAGLNVCGTVLDQLASSAAVLSEDEKALGVCVVDMGAGSCNLVYYTNGAVSHTSVVPVGGQHFTHDVAIGLRTPQISAEDIKIKHGIAMATLVNEDDTIEVEGVGGRKSRLVQRRDLAEVLEPRAEEVLQMIYHDLKMSGLMPFVGSGVVITGGASQLEGLVEMGEYMFDIPVRKGVPGTVGGLVEVVRSPAFATSVGLLIWAQKNKKFSRVSSLHSHEGRAASGSIAGKIKSFFDELF